MNEIHETIYYGIDIAAAANQVMADRGSFNGEKDVKIIRAEYLCNTMTRWAKEPLEMWKFTLVLLS